MYIKITDNLTSYDIHCIDELTDQCADTDGFVPPVFTGDNESGSDFPCFFLAYDREELNASDTSGKPVAFFSVFSADNKECEIYGVIPRKYRTDDIFDNIICSVCRTIKASLTSVTKILYVNDSRNIFCGNMLEKTGAKINFSTYLMKLSPEKISSLKISPYDTMHGVHVRVTTEKKNGIVKFRLIFFEDIRSHGIFRRHFGKEIGRCLCSVYENDNPMDTKKSTSLCIHNVLIDKAYRNRGFGTYLVRYAINYLNRHAPIKSVILNADAHNKAAVRLYLNLGFEIIQQLDYYVIDEEIS